MKTLSLYTKPLSIAVALTFSVNHFAVANETYTDERDPWEHWNRKFFVFNERMDEYVLRPVASAYREAMPGLLDKGVTNFFNNIDEITTFSNSLAQLKGHEATVTVTRFMFNTTMGVGGFFDVATSFELPRQDEDFGQTLAFWGVESGPYVMWPFLGPATVRHMSGRVVDGAVSPRWADDDLVYYGLNYGLKIVDRRADLIPAEGLLIGDKYTFVKNAYFQRRDYLVNDGVVDDPFADAEAQYYDEF